VPYFGIGNELWGCGGNMRAEFAADETRRYSTFIKLPEGAHTIKVASAPMSTITPGPRRDDAPAGKVDGLGCITTPCRGSGRRALGDGLRRERLAATLAEATASTNSSPATARSWTNMIPARVVLAVDEWGTWFAGSPAPIPASCTSRTPCATRWWRRSRSTSLPTMPIACG
jgi:alpha-N-arabinofuranosidase